MSTQIAIDLPRHESSPDEKSDSIARVFWRNAPFFFAILGVVLSLRIWIVYRALGVSISVGDAIASGFMECAVWPPFVALSLCVAQRLRASNWSAPSSFAFHLGAGALVSLGHLSTFAIISAGFRSLRFGDPFNVNLWSPIFSMFVPGVFMYGLIVVGAWWLGERANRNVVDSTSLLPEPLEPVEPLEPLKSVESLELRVGRGKLLMQAREIDWIQAAGNYLELHSTSGTHLVRETLGSLADRLGTQHFLRIHRSSVVRRSAVAAVEMKNGMHVILDDGTRLAVGKTFRADLLP
jgi:DNA-binding LytR/AlgR family response regulator